MIAKIISCRTDPMAQLKLIANMCMGRFKKTPLKFEKGIQEPEKKLGFG